MAVSTEVVRNEVRLSDLSGSEGASERVFHDPVSGHKLRIDLTDAEAVKLERAMGSLSRFVESARRSNRPSNNNADAAHIRAYARSQGREVPARGRLSAELVAQWEAAGRPRS